MYCTNCGENNSDTDKYCIRCGKPLYQGDVSVNPSTKSTVNQKTEISIPRKAVKSRRKIWVSISVILLIMAGVFISIYILGGDKEKNAEKSFIQNDDNLSGYASKKENKDNEGSKATVSDYDDTTEINSSDTAIANTDTSVKPEETTGEIIIQEDYQNGEEVIITDTEKSLLETLVMAAYSADINNVSLCTDYEIMQFAWHLINRPIVPVVTLENFGDANDYVSGEILSKVIIEGLGLSIDTNNLQYYEDILVTFEHTNKEGYVLFCNADGGTYHHISLDKIIYNDNNQICIIGKGYTSDTYDIQDLTKFKAYAVKNSDSRFAGYTLISIEREPATSIPITSVEASSNLETSKVADYVPMNICDNDLTTAWVEGADGYGIGEWIQFSWEEEHTVLGLSLANGYCKSNDSYFNNGRISKLLVEFSDGTEEVLSLDYESDDGVGNETQFYFIDREIHTNSIKITILDAFEGEKFEDTCISEIKFLN